MRRIVHRTMVLLLCAALGLASPPAAASAEDRALPSERAWIVWQFGPDEGVFIEGLRRGSVTGAASRCRVRAGGC